MWKTSRLSRADSDQFPSPFREVSRPRLGCLFVAGLILCACIVIVNVLRDNDLVHLAPASAWESLLKLKILSTDAAFTLFAALLGALLGYRQFYQTQRPHLTYNCVRANTVTFDRTTQGRYWTTVLRNGGGGPAQVTSVRYRIRLVNGVTYEGEHYAEAMAFLRVNGIREGSDFVLFRLGRGETIRSGSDWLLLEIDYDRAFNEIEAIDISIGVTGVAGGRFERDIYCIPRRWREERALSFAAADKAKAPAVRDRPSGDSFRPPETRSRPDSTRL